MTRISYAGESIHTSGEVAAALLEYWAALASRGLAEAVTVPVCDMDGAMSTAQMVIGIGNDLLAVPEPVGGREPDCGADAAGLRERTASLTAGRVTAVALPSDDLSYVVFDEFTDLI